MNRLLKKRKKCEVSHGTTRLSEPETQTLEKKVSSATFNPFRAPEPLPILNPSNVVPENGFLVVKGLNAQSTRHGARPGSRNTS